MSFRTGITATATLNGTELPITEWEVGRNDAAIQSFINSKTGIHPRKAPTFTDAAFTLYVDWDDANQPFIAPLTLSAGVFITAVKLLLDGPAGSLYWSFPSAIVRSIPQRVSRAGKIVTRIECEADGQFAPPGGALT